MSGSPTVRVAWPSAEVSVTMDDYVDDYGICGNSGENCDNYCWLISIAGEYASEYVIIHRLAIMAMSQSVEASEGFTTAPLVFGILLAVLWVET